jgi:tRNA A-37 threonylcarbamoyl transferase component Bud32
MRAGEQVGPFTIEKALGSGAMGTVFRARVEKTGQHVAIKIIAPGLSRNEKIMSRFEREADMLKQLKHANIVRLLATGRFQGTPFYAMEFIEGETLEDLLQRKGKLTWIEVVGIGKQICAALVHVHEAGILHRDLKPSNLMVTKDGIVKLTDFGIAKDLDQTQITSANFTVGTAAYMSPEQCRGQREITHKTDLYSLGIVLYELLIGRRPFRAETPMDMFLMHVKGKFERPGRIELDIPPALDTLICQLLEKKPEHRPRDAAMVARALEEVMEQVAAGESAGASVAGKVARRGKDEEDKEAAQALLTARRKVREPKRGLSKEQIYRRVVALGLFIAFLGIVALIVYALWPDSPEKRWQKALDYVEAGEAALEKGNFGDALVKLGDAQRKLEPIYSDSSNPYAEQAKEKDRYIVSAVVYIRVVQYLKGKTDWKTVVDDKSERGQDFKKLYVNLLENFPADWKYVERGRALLIKIELPELHRVGKEGTDLNQPTKWNEGTEALRALLRRYPAAPQAAEAKLILERLAVYRQLAEKMKQKPRPKGSSPIEQLALQALEDEEKKDKDAARAQWQRLADLRNKPDAALTSVDKPIEDPVLRGWILLAEEKLRLLQ